MRTLPSSNGQSAAKGRCTGLKPSPSLVAVRAHATSTRRATYLQQILLVSLGMLMGTHAIARDCSSVEDTQKRFEADKLMQVFVADRLFFDNEGEKRWANSAHNMAGTTYSGEELDNILAVNLLVKYSPSFKDSSVQRLKSKGQSSAAIDKGIGEAEEFTEIKLRQRMRMVLKQSRGLILYAYADKPGGVLLQSDKPLGEEPTELCVWAKFKSLTPMDYRGSVRPSKLKESSMFFTAIKGREKSRAFGIMIFGVLEDGLGIAFMGNPTISLETSNGVVLTGNNSETEKATLEFEMRSVRYGTGILVDKLKVYR